MVYDINNEHKSAVTVTGLTKSFRVYADRCNTLKDTMLFRHRHIYRDHTVLRDVSLQIQKGEAVALIGKNGCGKSTLLKLISRILYPDAGTVEVQGSVSSLLELGAGFHPEMTGRENIYTNASIFGLHRREITARLQDIMQFASLGDAIDRPVRTYSSGMYMRLAFAVAIHVGADVLLIDEILAVGDAAFQAKCMHRLQQLKAQGVTIIIVSHSLAQLERICDRSIWLAEGKIVMDGLPQQVHAQYLESLHLQNRHQPAQIIRNVHLQAAALCNADGEVITQCDGTQPLTLTLQYCTEKDPDTPLFAAATVAIYRADALLCWNSNTQREGLAPIKLLQHGTLQLTFSPMALANGNYWLDASLRNTESGALYDARHQLLHFTIQHANNEQGVVHIPHHWNINQKM